MEYKFGRRVRITGGAFKGNDGTMLDRTRCGIWIVMDSDDYRGPIEWVEPDHLESLLELV